jgi:predicted  nucleic acid-binding Zn-ribbon protein
MQIAFADSQRSAMQRELATLQHRCGALQQQQQLLQQQLHEARYDMARQRQASFTNIFTNIFTTSFTTSGALQQQQQLLQQQLHATARGNLEVLLFFC